ncbi:hypothetical protein ACO0QE_002230 [Hanseniaspora vineae]
MAHQQIEKGTEDVAANSIDHADDVRLEEKLNTMSTQLLESINKQSSLETKIFELQKQLTVYQKQEEKFVSSEQDLLDAQKTAELQEKKISALQNELSKEQAHKATAEQEANGLREEIGELSTSLFEEANKMVAVEKEKLYHKDKELNSLKGVLQEKEDILQSLEMQLKNLKAMLEADASCDDLVNESSVEAGPTSEAANLEKSVSKSSIPNSVNVDAIFSPTLHSIRFDTEMYSEFLKFIAVLPHSDSIYSTKNDSKFIKKLLREEIEPALKIDSAKGIPWAARSRILPAMMAGEVAIEPFSGINETFRYNTNTSSKARTDSSLSDTKMFKYPKDSPPVAVDEPCAFCFESRSDILEHNRLYCLKVFSSRDPKVVSKQYPLCHYCLLKIRQCCEIFAFLRSLKDGVWNLEKVTLKDLSKSGNHELFAGYNALKAPEPTKNGSGTLPNKSNASNGGLNAQEKHNRRKSLIDSFNYLSTGPVLEPEIQVNKTLATISVSVDGHASLPNNNIQRSWIQLCKLRAALYWCIVGIWSVDDCVSAKIVPFSKSAMSSLSSSSNLSSPKIASNTSSQVSLHSGTSNNFLRASNLNKSSIKEGNEDSSGKEPSSGVEINGNQEDLHKDNHLNATDEKSGETDVKNSDDKGPAGADQFDFEEPVAAASNSKEQEKVAPSPEIVDQSSTHETSIPNVEEHGLKVKSSDEEIFFDSIDEENNEGSAVTSANKDKKSRSSRHMSDLYRNLDSVTQDAETFCNS